MENKKINKSVKPARSNLVYTIFPNFYFQNLYLKSSDHIRKFQEFIIPMLWNSHSFYINFNYCILKKQLKRKTLFHT